MLAQHEYNPGMVNHHATALNLASVLEQQARLNPDRVAVTFAGTNLTYGEIDARASRLASRPANTLP